MGIVSPAAERVNYNLDPNLNESELKRLLGFYEEALRLSQEATEGESQAIDLEP